MKIGFYGDSFCCEISNPHSIVLGYDTYIKKIKKYYNAEIVNLGVGGSSIWDLVLNQFKVDNIPDVCIFCWTDSNRLYHPKLRNLTYNNLVNQKIKDIQIKDFFNFNVRNSAKKYFEHLHDTEKSELEYQSLLFYFDQTVLSKIINKTKIIHLWSFEKKYTWISGNEIITPLVNFTTKEKGMAANHIHGEEENQKIFELIKNQL